MAISSVKYQTKNAALLQIADLLEQDNAVILAANQKTWRRQKQAV